MAFAETPAEPPSLSALAERAAHRFPQPVRVGALIGREILAPTESQPILGHVKRVVRRKDGSLSMIMALGGVLGIGTRPIAVPLNAMGLLGEYVTCVDFTYTQLQAFPTDDGAGDTRLADDDTIRAPIVKPFH